MTKEFRIFGPPGTGKTTYISKQITNALAKYYPSEIYAVSFTNAAAIEIAGAQSGIPRSNVGTIHSLCYQSLGCPPIAEADNELIKDWNDRHPHWALNGGSSTDEVKVDLGLLQAYSRRRAMKRIRPDRREQAALRDKLSQMPAFIRAWESFKQETGSVDFTDMILQAPESIGAKVLFLDEAQDTNPISFEAVRRWGEQAEVFVVAGDDDQCLYGFSGSDPSVFFSPLPEGQIRVLSQSFRVPRKVHDYAQRWISKLAGRRQEKEYKPRDAEGALEKIPLSLKNTEAHALVSRMEADVDDGKSVMVLAQCAYQLNAVVDEIRRRGLPFHNPYRRRDGRWNPIRSTARRLEAFIECGLAAQLEAAGEQAPAIPAERWDHWMQMVTATGNLARGAKQNIAACDTSRDPLAPLEYVDNAEMLQAMLDLDIGWLQRNVTGRFRKALEYPVKVFGKCGIDGLNDEPKIIPGTIHSVKGGQADVVYLAPDMSYEAFRHLQDAGQPARDAMIRVMYVGMTRAREKLVLLQNSEKKFVNWI